MTGGPGRPDEPTPDPRVTAALARLFGSVEPAFLRDAASAASVRAVVGGEVLFREGDPGDAAYLVLEGRLRAVAGPAGADRALSDAGPGETVGELALLTGQPRSATVYAVRDGVVARIASADFDALLAAHPAAALPISRLLAERLRHATGSAVPAPPGEVAIAVFGLGEVDAAAFAAALGAALGSIIPVTVIGPTSADAAATPAVVVAGDRGWSAANAAILRRVDEVLLVADADADPRPGPVEAAVFAPRELGGPRVTLVLLQARAYPSGTRAWLDPRPVDTHLHVRRDDPADLARVARWVTGRSVALVLGGGGARGWAHVGAERALREAGVPIDLVGGTSHGALVGAAIADRHQYAEIVAVGREYVRRVRDPTLPIASLLRGRHILRGIRRVARPDADVADLWLPYFAVATNLSRADLEIIDRGPVADAIRASVSLPVVLPPIVRDGEVLVDGGLLDNLPIGPMRRRMGSGTIVAVDPSPRRTPGMYDDLAPDASGWGLLRDRLLRRRRRVPTIGDVLLRSVVVGSVRQRQRGADDPDLLLLTPELPELALLDFGALPVLAAAGYEAMREPVAAWWAARGLGGVRSRSTPP